jgi:hypothetical protein
LIDFSIKFSSPFERQHIPSGAHSDIGWWSALSAYWNSVQLIQPSCPNIFVATDVSGHKGLGGVWENLWYSSQYPRCYRSCNIQFKEIFAILQVILCWGDTWLGTHVVFQCDNQAVVEWLTGNTA